MTLLPIALNFSFKAFDEDETNVNEDLFFIDNNTLILNQTLIDTASIDSHDNISVTIVLHLKDGCTHRKKFKMLDNRLYQIPV